MYKIFNIVPWIMPPEPTQIQRIFQRFGRFESLPRGAVLNHGGTDGNVYLLTKGLVTFCYLDVQDHYQTLALILPHRTVGDLDSLDPCPCRVTAECLVKSDFLVMSRSRWIDAIRASCELMEAYALSANRKHQCTMEGMIANYTQPLETRLKLLLYSLIDAYYQLRRDDWNPLPTHLNITDISKVLASNRSWVSRTISSWADEGKIRKDGRRLLIHASLFEDICLPKPDFY